MEQERFTELYAKMKKILTYVVKCGIQFVNTQSGCFELMGIDFMVDDNFNPVLIEMNTNPAITLDTISQQSVIPTVINEMLDIVFKINSPERDLFFNQISHQQKVESFDILLFEKNVADKLLL